MPLKWGIASAGKISNDFVNAMKTLPTTNHQVVAIAARSQSGADKFAKEHSIPKAYEGYINLAKDPEVEVVYIGVLNPQHLEVTKLMLQNGKHVLCEKPMSMNEKQTKQLIQLAKEKKLFLMEAIWSRSFPAYRKMQQIIKSGVIGDVKFVSVDFGFPLNQVERVNAKELGGGATLDLGVYVLQFQQLVFRGMQPIEVKALGHLNQSETDASVSAVLRYPDGKLASVTVSAVVELANQARVIGTKGSIIIDNFWCPTKLVAFGNVEEFPLPKSSSKFNFKNSVGLAYEAEEVRQCIRAGKLESACVPWAESLELAKLMDTLRKQVGVVYPQDLE